MFLLTVGNYMVFKGLRGAYKMSNKDVIEMLEFLHLHKIFIDYLTQL